ncbi:unnamed protein product [Rhizophagus irregularis]|nr:unnamed protein product [Rhizophagus irregularis]
MSNDFNLKICTLWKFQADGVIRNNCNDESQPTHQKKNFYLDSHNFTLTLDGEVSVKEIEYLLDLSFKDYSIPGLPITFLSYIDFSKCLKTKIGD